MEKKHIYRILVASALILFITIGSRYYYSSSAKYVVLSTTTSFDATGFLDYLNTHVNIELRRTAVGTGMALLIADRGDADACIVHAPSLEHLFRLNGTFLERKVIAYNFFIIVGPSDDPAHVSEAKDAVDAFYRIMLYGEQTHQKVFVSRYDMSGTHVKEQYLWSQVIERYNLSITYDDIANQDRYVKAGAGMAQTLLMAQEFNAYTLSDIATYLVSKSNGLKLDELFDGDRYTLNVYSIMVVKNAKHLEAAEWLANYLAGPGQELFKTFGLNEFGHPLFYPARPLLEAYMNGELKPGTHNYVPPGIDADDLTLAERIFQYAFRDVNGDGNPDWSSGW